MHPIRRSISGALCRICANRALDPARPVVLVSSHGDSLHDNCRLGRPTGDEWLSAFDNSISNALLFHVLRAGRITPCALVAFPGDGGSDGRVARQVIASLGAHFPALFARPNMTINLDVPAECHGRFGFAVENGFAGARRPAADAGGAPIFVSYNV